MLTEMFCKIYTTGHDNLLILTLTRNSSLSVFYTQNYLFEPG